MTAYYPAGTEALGWLPAGHMTLLYGNTGTGKTTLALQAAAELARCRWTTVYVDLQNGFLPEWADHLGVPYQDQNQFALFQINDLEQIVHTVCPLMGTANLIVLDCFGAASIPRGNKDHLLNAMLTKLRTTNTAMLITESTRRQPTHGLVMQSARTVELEWDRGAKVRSYKIRKDRHSDRDDMGEFDLPEINP